MLRWAPLILLTAVTACSKLDHFYQKKSEYQQECLGDQSVKCRSILVDLNVTKLEAAIQIAGSRKENIIACRGQRFYDEGLEVIQEKIAYFKELKPGIFARVNEMVTLHPTSGYAGRVFFFRERGDHHARRNTDRH